VGVAGQTLRGGAGARRGAEGVQRAVAARCLVALRLERARRAQPARVRGVALEPGRALAVAEPGAPRGRARDGRAPCGLQRARPAEAVRRALRARGVAGRVLPGPCRTRHTLERGLRVVPCVPHAGGGGEGPLQLRAGVRVARGARDVAGVRLELAPHALVAAVQAVEAPAVALTVADVRGVDPLVGARVHRTLGARAGLLREEASLPARDARQTGLRARSRHEHQGKQRAHPVADARPLILLFQL